MRRLGGARSRGIFGKHFTNHAKSPALSPVLPLLVFGESVHKEVGLGPRWVTVAVGDRDLLLLLRTATATVD